MKNTIKNIAYIITFSIATLCILPMKAMESGSIQQSGGLSQSLLQRSDKNVIDRQVVRGGLGIVAGVGEISKVVYMSFALDEGSSVSTNHQEMPVSMVADVTLAIFFFIYGIAILRGFTTR